VRCPDCNKFVSYADDFEVEVLADEVIITADDVARVYAEIRIALACDECGTELKETNFEIEEIEIDLAGKKLTEEECELEFDLSPLAQWAGEGRSTKTFYGFDGTVILVSGAWKSKPAQISDRSLASWMDELV